MVMVEESNPGKLRVGHALTGKRVKYFPPELNLTRFRVTELSEGYSISNSEHVHKVILCSNLSGESRNSNIGPAVQAMVYYKDGSLGKLTLKEDDDDDDGDSDTDDGDGDDDDDDDDDGGCTWQQLRVRSGEKWFLYLDDIVYFKGMYCGVDRSGKLHILDPNSMTVGPVLVSDPLFRRNWGSVRRKRLVVDPTTRQLHLVVREHVHEKARFKVYTFNEGHKRWDVVEGIGSDKVLFVGLTHCFFARPKDFSGCDVEIGNCIVFVANCFTQYCKCDYPDRILFGKEDQHVGIHRLGEEDNFCLISCYPGFSQMIWPPPTWFSPKQEYDNEKDMTESDVSDEGSSEANCSSKSSLPDEYEEGILTDSSGSGTSTEEEEDDVDVEEILSDCQEASKVSSSDDTSLSDEDDEEDADADSSEDQPHGEWAQTNSSEEVQPHVAEGEAHIHSSEVDQPHAFESKCTDEPRHISSERVTDEQTARNLSGPPMTIGFEERIPRTASRINDPAHDHDILEDKVFLTPMTPSATQSLGNLVSTIKFQGVDIKSHLLPTLQTIWAKHGSLISEDTVRSKEMLACALESLAKMTITLQNSTVRTLTESRADELRSNLCDLQRVGLKIDWLVPIVDKALALQKSKPLIESLVALEKEKAEADEKEKKFLAESAKVKLEIEEKKARLFAGMPFAEPIDLDEYCLGGLC